jgi:NitT/TauT family transport system substrate-binding protein
MFRTDKTSQAPAARLPEEIDMRAPIATDHTATRTKTVIARTLGAVLAAALAVPGCKRAEPEGADPAAAGDPAAPATKDTPAAAPAQKTEVTLQLNWVPEPEFGGFYAAAHKGLYEQAGLKVNLVAGGAGVATWNMVATGKVPFGIAGADEVIRARLQDANLVALYAVHQTNPQAIMAHAGSGVSSLEEIFTSGKIKRVIMEPGLAYGRFVQQKYGFDKVEIVQYSGNLSLFLQDKDAAQQCYVFSEPVSAAEQGVEVKAFSVAESGFNLYQTVVVTSQAYLDQNPAVVEAFVRATRAGWQAYLDDPEPTNEYMKTQQATMTMSAMKRAADMQTPYIITDETRAKYLGYMSEERWRVLGEQLVSVGEIQQAPADVTTLFRNIPPQ